MLQLRLITFSPFELSFICLIDCKSFLIDDSSAVLVAMGKQQLLIAYLKIQPTHIGDEVYM